MGRTGLAVALVAASAFSGAGSAAVREAAPSYGDPAWSRDGKRIAFVEQRHADGETFGTLWTMRPDGSAKTEVVGPMARLTWPSWSPDGRRIAFNANGQRIYVVNADGSGLRAIVTNERKRDLAPFGLFPAWSPGGRKIAYTEPTGDDTAGNIVVANPDGSGQTYAAVTDGTFAAYEMPTWSPGGQRLAFYTVRPPDSANTVSPHLAFIQRYGGDIRDLSREDAAEPDWSPDGRKIVASFTGTRVGVVTLRTDRTRFLHSGYHPRWSPDGRRIVFADNGQIFVMYANGTNVRQLTHEP